MRSRGASSARSAGRTIAALGVVLLALSPLPSRSESASDRLTKLRAEIEDR